MTPRAGIPSRLRLRRRLLLFSAPVILAALLIGYKAISLVIAGDAAVSAVHHRNTGELRAAVSALSFADIVGGDNLAMARGDLAALQGRLSEAESRFTGLLARTVPSRSCPVRINLELVTETEGDIAARSGQPGQAEQRYLTALGVVRAAPAGCFAANTDPDQDRRTVRNEAAARLAAKIAALHRPPPVTSPPLGTSPPPDTSPPPAAPPPPPPAAASVPAGPAVSDVGPDRLPGSGPLPDLRLDPGSGEPLDRLQQALRNSDASGQSAR